MRIRSILIICGINFVLAFNRHSNEQARWLRSSPQHINSHILSRFMDAEPLGSGTYGTVFKANHDNMTIVVKAGTEVPKAQKYLRRGDAHEHLLRFETISILDYTMVLLCMNRSGCEYTRGCNTHSWKLCCTIYRRDVGPGAWNHSTSLEALRHRAYSSRFY